MANNHAQKLPLTYRDFTKMGLAMLTSVSDKRAQRLKGMGIANLYELLMCFPRRYIDRTAQHSIAQAKVGDTTTIVVRVNSVETRRARGGRSFVTVQTSDGSGYLSLSFFNQPWRAKQLSAGEEIIVYGKVDTYRSAKKMTNPLVEKFQSQTGKIVALYPSSQKQSISSNEISKAVTETLRRSQQRQLADPLPENIRKKHRLISRQEALQNIHVPTELAQLGPARKRLVFDELFTLQLSLLQQKHQAQTETVGISHSNSDELVNELKASLGFELTAAQNTAIAEIKADMCAENPMHRLLQGDVGSGKTLVALAAMLMAAQGQHQAVLMAPTEVLAEQHYASIKALCDNLEVAVTYHAEQLPLGMNRAVSVALLTNRTTASERAEMQKRLDNGDLDIVIGTHALIYDSLHFPSLGVAVIDEQHRFGVQQRAALRSKGPNAKSPDVLVMTATPIPRTAAMTVFGDLDMSVLDEMPAGRVEIQTRWVARNTQEAIVANGPQPLDTSTMWARIKEQIDAGHQAYVVTPLIEESEKQNVANAEQTLQDLAANHLKGYSLALLHGRMDSTQKESVMQAFRCGETQVLVATTVIEVGVDVSNATAMVIMDADRFGIAQLHQLRGRVGRSALQSYCYLVADPETENAFTRINALVSSTDGFALAEVDLQLRGEGSILGERQKGVGALRIAKLNRDLEWIQKARQEAAALLKQDPQLTQHPGLASDIEVFFDQSEAEYLLKS